MAPWFYQLVSERPPAPPPAASAASRDCGRVVARVSAEYLERCGPKDATGAGRLPLLLCSGPFFSPLLPLPPWAQDV